MAVKPANSRYHTFTFNGVRAADYGIYVTDVNVFNSAARDVEYIQIPGRDGAFALDRGRFQNISVVYKCAMTQDTDEDFATAISEFRNAIASTKGYKRLEDDIHTDEYRMGVFSKGLEAPTLNTKTATFDVEFNCQPQRFLKSGETAVTIGGSVTNTQTKSGAVVSIDSDGGDKATSLIATIEAVQAGNGDPSPTNVRAITGWTAANVNVAGKNLLYHIYPSQTINGVEFVLRDDGTVIANGTATANAEFSLTYRISGTYGTTRLPHGDYIITGCPSGGGSSTYEIGINTTKNGSGVTIAHDYGNGAAFTMDSNALIGSWITIRRGVTVNNLVFKPMVRLASETDATYEPYKGTTHTVSFGSAGTVYGGTLDVITGVLTVTHGFYNYGSISTTSGSAVTGGWRCDFQCPSDDVNRGKWSVQTGGQPVLSMFNQKGMNEGGVSKGYSANGYTVIVPNATSKAEADAALKNLQIVYKLATPQTYTLTAQQVELLAGNNTVWTDTGDTTLTYGRDPNKIVNPTLFESHPLLHLWGYGSIGINGDQLSINNDQYGKILLVDKTKHETRGLSKYIYRNSDHPNPKVSLMNEGDTLTLVGGSFISVQLYGVPVVRFTNVSVSVGGGISASVPSGATQIKNILLTFPEYTFSFGTTKTETIPITITAAYTYEGAQRTATVTGDIRVVYNVGSFYQAVSITILNITNTKPDDLTVSPNADKNGTLQAIYGYSTKRPFAEDADFYFDLDIGEAYKIEDGQTVSVNNAVTIPAQLPTLKSGENTITYDDTITQFKIVPRWWEV